MTLKRKCFVRRQIEKTQKFPFGHDALFVVLRHGHDGVVFDPHCIHRWLTLVGT